MTNTYREAMTENRSLAKRFPFLRHRLWNGEIDPEDTFEHIGIKYDIPEGWWKRFGIPLCEDLKEVLERNDGLYRCTVLQAKEKYGSLRLYLHDAPAEWDSHDWAWSYIAKHTCIKCGAFPVPMRNYGWISPWCDQCFSEALNRPGGEYISEKRIQKCTETENGRLQEYLFLRRYGKRGHKDSMVDMKPYYDRIGWKYREQDLILLDEIIRKEEEITDNGLSN